MKYAVEIGLGAMIQTPSFIKIDSGIQKLIRRGYTDTQTAWKSHKTPWPRTIPTERPPLVGEVTANFCA
jgi:hypothetical protein